MDKKDISIVSQEIFSTIDGNLESIIQDVFPLEHDKQEKAISYIIDHLDNTPIPELSEYPELNEDINEINNSISYFKNLYKQDDFTLDEWKNIYQKIKELLIKSVIFYPESDLEKEYIHKLNTASSEEKKNLISEYKLSLENLSKQNIQALQKQEQDKRTGKEITNIEEHKLVKEGIVTQEEISPYLSHYELLSSITADENEEISLVKKLFEAARNFYENNPAQGLQELMEIPHQKASDLLKANILQTLGNKQISFIDVNYIEASELDRINNIEIKPHYKLFECIIASRCPLTLQKLIDDNKIDKFKKEELDLVVALFTKNTEILSKNLDIKLNNEIGKLLLTPSISLAYELKELIPFINIKDLGNEVFTMAALCQEIDIMKKIEQEINLTAKTITDLINTSIANANLEIVSYLLSLEKTNINEKNSGGWAPLNMAIAENQLAIVELLLKHESIKVNEKDPRGHTSLALAVSVVDSNPEIVKLLLKHKSIEVNEKDPDGYTPLHQAINSNKPEIVELLLKHESINVNEKDPIGNTTLYQAVTHNRFEIVKILIEHPKINVNETNLYGNTPLHQANSYNYFSIVELLLKHKDINIHKKNLHNSTPLDLATNKPEIVKLFDNYKECHEISTVSQEQEVQILGEEHNYDTFDGA